jgi:hypothetical protein
MKKKLLELMDKFSMVARYKVNMKKNSDEQSKNEFKKTISLSSWFKIYCTGSCVGHLVSNW